MAGRRVKPQVNRHQWHEDRVKAAKTPKQALWAYCHWLVAEAFHAGPIHVEDATRLVRERIHELKEVTAS